MSEVKYAMSLCGSCASYDHERRWCRGHIGCPPHNEHPESIRCLWWIRKREKTEDDDATVISTAEWEDIYGEFKTVIDGEKYVLVPSQSGTVYVPVKVTEVGNETTNDV